MASAQYDVTSDSGHAGGQRSGRVAFARTQKADDESTQVRMPAGLVREFHDWFASQYPGLKQLPKADPYIADASRRGLAELKQLLPPVESLDDKIAKLEKAS